MPLLGFNPGGGEGKGGEAILSARKILKVVNYVYVVNCSFCLLSNVNFERTRLLRKNVGNVATDNDLLADHRFVNLSSSPDSRQPPSL